MDAGLFDNLPINLPLLEEGETLYSWCARYHRLSGNAIAGYSCAQLFGTRRPSLKHDFPTNLSTFSKRTCGCLGDPEALALERTLLGYYASFISLERYQQILEAVCDQGKVEPKHLLGLMASRVGASHPLKACPECIQHDLDELGFSRWIVEHQWPSVWICRHHGTPLLRLASHSQPRELRDWTLPEDYSGSDWESLPGLRAEFVEKLAHIASISAGIGKISVVFDEDHLRNAYRQGARDRGWVAFDGSLRMLAMTRHLATCFGELVNVQGFGFLADADPNGGGVIGLLTRRFPGLRHPVKHAALIAFLFDSVENFIDAYRGATATADAVVGIGREDLRRLVVSEKWSVNRAANATGVPVSQACRWLESAGIPYKHRPRMLSDQTKEKLSNMLKAGEDYRQIAEVTGLKKSLVRAFAASNPILRDVWRVKRFERLRVSHRAHAMELFNAMQGASIKALKSVKGNGLAWLERHDREWLAQAVPNLLIL